MSAASVADTAIADTVVADNNDEQTELQPQDEQKMFYEKDALLQSVALMHMQVFALQHSQLQIMLKQHEEKQKTQYRFQTPDTWLRQRTQTAELGQLIDRAVDDVEISLLGLLDSSGVLSSPPRTDALVVLMCRVYRVTNLCSRLTKLC
jgi:hypothetical protein